MKKILTVIEPAVFAAALAAVYYFLPIPLAEWVRSVDNLGVLSEKGALFAALLIINLIATIEIAFLYRLRKLGKPNLGIHTRFKPIDLLIPVIAIVALGLYWGITRLFGVSPEISLPSIPLDWVILILLIAITSIGSELLLNGFILNSLSTKRGLPLWLAGVIGVIVAFIPTAFIPGIALGFAASAIPLIIYYVIRRNYWGTVIARASFFAGVIVVSAANLL